MINLAILLPMVSMALLFVLVVTHAYKRSVTTTIYVISVVIAMNCYSFCSPALSGAIVTVGALVALVRAVVNTENDRLFKRDRKCSRC